MQGKRALKKDAARRKPSEVKSQIEVLAKMLSEIAFIVIVVATVLSTPAQCTGYDHGWKEPCVGKDFKGIRL